MTRDLIIIGADHAGLALKEGIKKHLEQREWKVTDAGTYNAESSDYPDFGEIVARGVSSGQYVRGILVCASGVGMTIVANKYPQVRAVLALDEDTARMSRRHNDTNILVLAGKRTPIEMAERIIEIWLSTSFEGGRHARRLDKIKNIENSLSGGTRGKENQGK